MASLKDLRNRITSVKSTRKITSAMKMVAAAKLRRAEEQAAAARPYAERMQRMLASLAESTKDQVGAPRMLAGTGKDDTHLVVVCTADRGLCGGFNSNIARAARKHIESLIEDGKDVKIFCVGRKGRDLLRRSFPKRIVDQREGIARQRVEFEVAAEIAKSITTMFEDEEFDVCTLFFSRFKSAISQIPTEQQLIPFAAPPSEDNGDDEQAEESGATGKSSFGGAVYEYEPSEEEILADLLPRNLAVQVFRALQENFAGEQGARMSAMDNATRNADEMIDDLTTTYNRTRQAVITKELIEIVSAKEAM
jgi:F-type H+-transporting ATPase subunit gamma